METYTIKKSEHSSGLSFWPQILKQKMFKRFKFDSSCEYDLKDVDQFDINKLFGWSQLYHQHNSCRLGWTWNLKKKKMEIYAYCYVNGKRLNEYICDVDLDTWYCGQIWLENGNYYFRVLSDKKDEILGYASIPYGFKVNAGYLLKPYFGGNESAPHEMKIFLENEN
jgi:hypothetical protein